MSAFHAAPSVNPPLPFTPKAVIDRLRFHATNGPAYVQLGATKAVARILGLYDQSKDLAQRLAEPILGEPTTTAKPKQKQKLHPVIAAQMLVRGEDLPEEEEEEGGNEDADPL